MVSRWSEHTHSVNYVGCSADGTRVICGSDNNTVRVWKAESEEPMVQPLVEHIYMVNGVAWSRDGRLVVQGVGGGEWESIGSQSRQWRLVMTPRGCWYKAKTE